MAQQAEMTEQALPDELRVNLYSWWIPTLYQGRSARSAFIASST